MLSPAEGQVSYVLRTRSPLRYIAASPFDLHVLGTPPAFILSQDQTLRQLRPLRGHRLPLSNLTGSFFLALLRCLLPITIHLLRCPQTKRPRPAGPGLGGHFTPL
jgi:hypothetical protein